MENTEPIELRFYMRDEYGSETTLEIIENDYGDDVTQLQFVCERFERFLKACGFVRPGFTILEDSLTENEYNYLKDVLNHYRGKDNANEYT